MDQRFVHNVLHDSNCVIHFTILRFSFLRISSLHCFFCSQTVAEPVHSSATLRFGAHSFLLSLLNACEIMRAINNHNGRSLILLHPECIQKANCTRHTYRAAIAHLSHSWFRATLEQQRFTVNAAIDQCSFIISMWNRARSDRKRFQNSCAQHTIERLVCLFHGTYQISVDFDILIC